MKILIVDDSAIARRFLTRSLPTDIDLQITERTNGQEGVQAFKEIKPDLTFMDLTMPVMGGIEALRQIKDIDDKAVVYVLTADVQNATYDTVMSLGACKFLRKPPTKEIICAAVYELNDFLRKGL
jgi:two-component system chemotaxis response regulator CheY